MHRRLLPLLLVVLIGALTVHWLPSRQVRLHQRNLEKAVEARNWKRVAHFVSADYHDRWGQTRDLVLKRLPEAFQDYVAPGILTENIAISGGSPRVLHENLKLVGRGGIYAQFMMNEVERLREPFAFTWKKEGWLPWDWALVSVDQPEVEIPSDVESYDESSAL